MTGTVEVIPRAALPSDTLKLARWLIGRVVVRRIGRIVMSGRIVETEAYLRDDAASHTFRGETPRNRAMFLARGYAYVYFIYGTAFMLNVSAEGVGVGSGVLIRALEPMQGIAHMERNRGTDVLRDLTRGPGRLAQALAIDGSLNAMDLCKRGPLWLGRDDYVIGAIGASARIGIRKNVEPHWRFYLKGNRFVSGRPTN